MATYKVIQDIEAEDHILGPLSLRQFIFAIIAVVCLYFCYLVLSKGAPYLMVIFLPPGIFAGFFAFPFGKDQPTEVWALAKIRFLFKPRRRIWDQSGIKELVTITAPKKVEEQRTNGLSQTEVRSRLSALASTIDSRGWAIKNVNVNLYSQPGTLPIGANSDRLIDVSSIPQDVPNYDVQAADDIMDEQNNPIAQQFDKLINASTQNHRQQLVSMLNQPTAPPQAAAPPSAGQAQGQPANYWFLDQPTATPKLTRNQEIFAAPQVITPGSDDSQLPVVQAVEPTAEEEALSEHIKEGNARTEATYANLKTILPLDQQHPKPPTNPTPTPAPAQPNPAFIQLANNNDLNISTIAREAGKDYRTNPSDGGEVVIALH